MTDFSEERNISMRMPAYACMCVARYEHATATNPRAEIESDEDDAATNRYIPFSLEGGFGRELPRSIIIAQRSAAYVAGEW